MNSSVVMGTGPVARVLAWDVFCDFLTSQSVSLFLACNILSNSDLSFLSSPLATRCQSILKIELIDRPFVEESEFLMELFVL